ncbi:MAG: hypothetical protein ABIO43_06420 [Sphingomicrobium sp.]
MAQGSTSSYWLETAPPFYGGAAGVIKGRGDVSITGGGFTGPLAALALEKYGATVATLKQDMLH